MRGDLANRRNEIRARIVEAAIVEFADNGLRGASTQGIADRAGITKTKLHYHISGKEELYLQVLDRITATWAALFDGVPLNQGPEDFLSDYIARKVRYSLERPAEVKLFVGEVMRGGEHLRDRWEPSKTTVLRAAARIEDWCDRGLIRRVHPVLLQFNIWSLTEQYAVMAKEARYMMGLDDGQPLDGALIAREITALVINGLRVAREPRDRRGPRTRSRDVTEML